MRFEDEELEHMERVNHLMDNIYNHADDIYESLMDERHIELVEHLQGLSLIVRKLIKKYKS